MRKIANPVWTSIHAGPRAQRRLWIESNRALQVKVYARLPNDKVRFHKDGYTDLRGRFGYASVSESDTEDAQRYAIQSRRTGANRPSADR
ncbi:MAG: hypothetical protein HYR85_03965 [Planctomycetes bacterium]|nr:hypothetical protein [Planctomycetota bacterium]MBI3843880.1 hypothetical protein [Planctomycetota bacterium]